MRCATTPQSGLTVLVPAIPSIRRASASRFAGTDHHLGRDAPPVGALPTDELSLDADDLEPRVHEAPGHLFTTDAHADDDDI